jgi:light-regulated signal transduction histidine kinase (bacteriophytochrome)
LETFKNAATRVELCELAVRGLKAITGYDRVLAYRFAPDGHGEVIAEDRAPHLEPYLGLRYPAGDIPPQARAMYLRQRVGAIADSSYRPVPVIVDPALDGDITLDLTHSTLRSVSPIHCEYMRNMNTAASLTIGLAHRQDLWGMLVCHHETPRVAGPELRAVAEMIGQVVSLLLDSLGTGEVYARRLERNDTLRALTDRLSGSAPLAEALVAAQSELLDLVEATGAALRLDGKVTILGRAPPLPSAERAMAVLSVAMAGEVGAVDDLGLRHPELACCTLAGSGALLLRLAPDSEDAILWFRPELSQTIAWGGNPAEHASSDPVTGKLSARTSFAAWQETVRGRSAPWAEADLALARELRSVVAAAAAQRTSAALARLRHYDPLTGLPNRSLLEDRMQDTRPHTGAVAAMLFLDLDRFKAVNDTMGHAAGGHVAGRSRATTARGRRSGEHGRAARRRRVRRAVPRLVAGGGRRTR